MVRLRPGDAVAMNELALAYHLARDQRALPTALQALAAAPDSAHILDTAGWLHSEMGKASDALPLLRRAVALEPRAAAPGLHLAAALVRTGDKAGARKELDRLAAADPAVVQSSEFKALRAGL